MKCTKCGSIKTDLFPHCDYTFGCPDCGNVFTRQKK